jgi:AraC-like DNA-binding protein
MPVVFANWVPMSHSQLARTIDFRVLGGIELQFGRSERGGFEPHFHEEYQVLVVTEGAFRLVTARQKHAIESGMVCVLNPHEAHACESVSGGWSCITMYVPRDVLQRMRPDWNSGNRGFEAPAIDSPEMAYALTSAHQEAINSGDTSALFESLRKLVDHHSTEVSQSQPKDAVERVITHLQERYVSGTPLSELAAVANLSPYHFIRVFTRETGLTPLTYQNNLRLARAKRSLRVQARGAQAAIDSGYYDQSHLTRAFQRTHGLTPGVFRRAFKHAQRG